MFIFGGVVSYQKHNLEPNLSSMLSLKHTPLNKLCNGLENTKPVQLLEDDDFNLLSHCVELFHNDALM